MIGNVSGCRRCVLRVLGFRGWAVHVSDPRRVGYVCVGIGLDLIWWVRAPTLLRGFSRGFCLVGVS